MYGTPQIYALTAKLTEDRIPGTSPGFGSAAAADGQRYPYIFPIAATYWSQAAAAVDFAKKQLAAASRARRSPICSTTTRPAGSRIDVLGTSRSRRASSCKTFAVPPPGVEMGAQVLDIAQRFRADFVISHLFGGAPSVSIKELKRVGYPMRKVIGLVWASAEANIEGPAASGWPTGTSPCSSPAWAPTTRC